jgi:hypothetical protein
MRFLKKVTVSALGGTGTIVDSLVSGSDPATNAPSIRAVNEKLGVNNMLFNSDFVCNKNEAGAPTGWDLSGGASYTPARGLWIVKNTTPVIKSPYFMPYWFNSEGVFDFPITISAQVLRGNIEEYSTTFNSYGELMSGKNLFEIYDNVFLKVKAVYKREQTSPNNNYCLQFEATGVISSSMSDSVFIMRLKAEKGLTATPFITSMRDYALIESLQERVGGLKVFEFSGTLPANTSGIEVLEAESGYNLSILAAYAYNSQDAKYYEMAKPDVVGASYYRPTIYTYGKNARIQLDATSVTNYAGQAYKVFALGWRA